MKKILLLSVFFVVIFSFGCYKTSTNGSICDVAIYSKDEVKIDGQWKEGYHNYSQFGILKLNSPAPIVYEYFVNALGYNDLLICFDVYLYDDYKVKSIRTNLFDIQEDDFYKVEYNDHHALCYYLFENINPDSKDFVYISFDRVTLLNEKTGKTETGSWYFATRTQNQGICLSFLSEISDAIISLNNMDQLSYKICSLYTKEDLENLKALYNEENDYYILTVDNVDYYFKAYNDCFMLFKIEGDVKYFDLYYLNKSTIERVEKVMKSEKFILEQSDLDSLTQTYRFDNLYINYLYDKTTDYYVKRITVEIK